MLSVYCSHGCSQRYDFPPLLFRSSFRYPSTVATLSRRTRDLVEHGFARTADEEQNWQIEFKLHDFGFR
jgi:hypothetical protein